MRGKWVLAAGAVLALVVVGGVGGLTMRAFAGTAHSTVKSTTVTRLCVYVDRRDSGDSYGDLSTQSTYGHKTCIVGKQGPAGNNSVVTWNKTLLTAGSPPPQVARRKTGGVSGPTTVDLATDGPFTVVGECWASDGNTTAVTDVVTTQDNSSLFWFDTNDPGSFGTGSGAVEVSNPAFNDDPADPTFVGEGTSGEFSVSTADQATVFTGTANNGSYMNGEASPPCSFSGDIVLEK